MCIIILSTSQDKAEMMSYKNPQQDIYYHDSWMAYLCLQHTHMYTYSTRGQIKQSL